MKYFYRLLIKIVLFIFSSFTLVPDLAQALIQPDQIKLATNHFSACGNFIRADQNSVYTGFGPYWTGSLHNRKPMPGQLRWIQLQPRTDAGENKVVEHYVDTLDSAIDFISYDGHGYVLTYSGIEDWDLMNNKRMAVLPTQSGDVKFGDEQHPRSFAQYKDKLIIAHGRLGVSFLNLTSGTITNTLRLISSQAPLESMAQSVTVSGRYAFVDLDSYSLVGANEPTAFRGIVVIDIETEKVIREIGDLPPGLDSISSDQKVLILSFYGNPLWKYSIPAVLNAKKPQPVNRVFKFPVLGHPTGKALLDDVYYHSCFSKMPEAGEGPYFKKTKITLNRRQLMLD
jgi:hypothetical protein